MSVQIDTITGPVASSDGGGNRPIRQGRIGALVTADSHGRLFEPSSRGQLYMASANLTVPVIYTATVGVGGPLLWNGSTKVNAGIVSVGWALTTANTTTAYALGITGNSGQTSAPTTATAIDTSSNCFIGGAPPNCSVFRLGTVVNGGKFLMPFAQVHTSTVLTVDTTAMQWVELSSMFVVPPNCWASVSASAAGTAGVLTIGIVWEEVPV
jgi:hypothetical protein